MKRVFNFNLEGVSGDFELSVNPFASTLLQDGCLVVKSGLFGRKYEILTNERTREPLKVSLGGDYVYTLYFRGEKIPLESKLTKSEYILGGLPLALIFIGGLLGGLLGSVGASVNYHIIRQYRNKYLKVGAVILVSLLTVALYYVLALLLNIMLKN